MELKEYSEFQLLERIGNPFSKGGMTEVRCCCNPGKLLGYLPYAGAIPRNSERRKLIPFTTKDGELTWEEFHLLHMGFNLGFAFKSNDKGIDHFRNIKGFVEATEQNPLPAE